MPPHRPSPVSPALACLALIATGGMAFLFLEGRRELIGAPLFLVPLAHPSVFLPLLAGLALPLVERLLPPRLRPRLPGWLLLLTAAVLLAVTAGLSPSRAPERLLHAGGALLLLFAAFCLGARCAGWLGIRPAAPSPPNDAPRAATAPDPATPTGPERETVPPGPTAIEAAALAWGVGLAALALLVFLAGLAGGLHPLAGWGLALLSLFSGFAPALRLLRAAGREAALGAQALGFTGWAILGFLVAGVCMLLPGAFYPPLDYDVLSYHLQLPREYMAAGAIRVLPHSPFSGFPQTTEMLWLLSLLLGGGPEHGLWIAKLVNAGCLPLLLAGAGLAARRVAGAVGGDGATGGLSAAALALGAWQTVSLAMKLYVELLMGAFVLLALLALLLAWSDRSRFLRFAALAGLLAGAAAGTKYTGLLYAGAPVTGLLLILPVRGVGLRKRLAGALLAGVACWLVLAPWLLRNATETGNPVYPLWNRAFGVAAWSPAQEARFRAAHRAEDHSAREMLRQAYRVGIGGSRRIFARDPAPRTGRSLGALGFLFAPLCLLLPRRGGAAGRAAGLGLWIATVFLFWFFLTHRFERFFHQGYLLGCVLSGSGLAAFFRWRGALGGRRLASHVLGLLGAFFAALNLGTVLAAEWTQPIGPRGESSVLRVLLGQDPPAALLAGYTTNWPLREALAALPPESETLLLGTADPFWLPGTVRYATVFARHPLLAAAESAKSAEALRRRLREMGVTHLAIHWPELARLHATHSRAYRLSPEAQARLAALLRRAARPLRMPGVPPWRIGEAAGANDRLGILLDDWAVLFPDHRPAGRYGLRPIELFALGDEALPAAEDR